MLQTSEYAQIPINIRAGHYLIAQTVGICARCHASTPLLALVLPPGHEALDEDDETDETEPAGTWRMAGAAAFLFYVEYVPASVQTQLQAATRSGATRSYRPCQSDATEAPYWGNHCEHCGLLWDEQELFCEPGPLLPTSEGEARLIHLLCVDEPFEAAAAGYSYEPEFFDFMSRG